MFLYSYITHKAQGLISLRGIDTFPGGGWRTASKLFCLPFESGSALNEFAPLGRLFFPFRLDPFSEGTQCAGTKQEVKNAVSLEN